MRTPLVKLSLLGVCALALLFIHGAEAKLLKWTCAYPRVANPNGAFGHQDYSVEFTLDNVTGRASVIRNTGSNGAVLFAGTDSLTFLERPDASTIQTTTIDRSGSSVHSRHVIMGGRLVPSQSYGHCSVGSPAPLSQ
jgi:hypothetical protein